MEKNYAYEIKKAIKERYNNAKKDNEETSTYTKCNILKLVENCNNTKKIEYLYKYRYAILNGEFCNPNLVSVYEKLFKKILFTNENSCIFTEWTNIFTTIFGNMPVIYNKVGLDYITKIVDIFCNTNNENKLKCIMNLFVTIYNVEIDDLKYIDLILLEIEKEENEFKLNNYNIIAKNIYKITDNEILKKYFEYIIYQLSDSISKHNSEYLSELIKVLIDDDNNLEKEYVMILLLLKTFATSENKELIYAYHSLITNSEFIKADSVLQNKCILLLKKISEDNFMKIRLVTQIIIDIIIVSDNKEINNYLLNKLLIVKNNKTLELILKLEPVLSSFTDDKEFIRVIDSLEDREAKLTKKLIINLENE